MDSKAFQLLIRTAVLTGMEKVLARCEYCVACDTSGRYNEALHCFQPQSVVRIVRGLRKRAKCRKAEMYPEDFLKNRWLFDQES